MAGEGTWCVYLPEFITVFTSTELHEDGQRECQEKAKALRAGKSQVVWTSDSGRCQLQLWVPNLRGEYKDQAVAQAVARALGLEAEVVPQGSAREQELLNRNP